jgi:hypothetical protein
MQDHITQIDEIFLHRTAGPYIGVKSGKTQTEHILSALPSIADILEANRVSTKLGRCRSFEATILMSAIGAIADDICERRETGRE